MIGDLFFQIVFWFANGLVNMFPLSEGLPPDVMASANYIGGYLVMFEPVIPVGTLSATVALVLTVELAIYGFRTLKWVVSHLPLIGGRG